MRYPGAPYASLPRESLVTEFETVSRELSAAHVELAEVKVQYLYLFLSGYKQSTGASVAARDRDGEIAAVAIREDELTLLGRIDSLTVIRDFLLTLL